MNELLLDTQTSADAGKIQCWLGQIKTPFKNDLQLVKHIEEMMMMRPTHINLMQIEGLVIDRKERNVSLADLKGTLEVLVRKMIGSKT